MCESVIMLVGHFCYNLVVASLTFMNLAVSLLILEIVFPRYRTKRKMLFCIPCRTQGLQ